MGLSQILGHHPELQTAEEAKQPEPAEAASPSPQRAREGLRRGQRGRPLGGQGDFVAHTWVRACVLSCAQLLVEMARPAVRALSEPWVSSWEEADGGRGCLRLVSPWLGQLPAANSCLCFLLLL